MANSVKPGTSGTPHHHRHRTRHHTAEVPAKALLPAKTAGTQGHADQHDPTLTSILGWTPNLTGFRDWVDHTLHTVEDYWNEHVHTPGGIAVDKKTAVPLATGAKPPQAGDLDLSFLGPFVGGTISDGDIRAAAASLDCEPALIYAISKQESGTSSFQTIQGRLVPVILYERHIFRNYSRPSKGAASPFEVSDPDICGPAYHTTVVDKTDPKKKRRIDAVTGLAPLEKDTYAHGVHANYVRLCRAYKLNKAAALEACSWGKYQIMGFNFDAKTQKDVFTFVKDMSSGEPAHIKAFLRFAKTNALLLHGLQNNNYEEIAAGHNGTGWRKTNPDYAKNIEMYSKEYK